MAGVKTYQKTTLIDRLRKAARDAHPGASHAAVHLADIDEAIRKLEALERIRTGEES